MYVVHTSAAARSPEIAGLLERASAAEISVSEMDDEAFQELSDTVTPQGILAVAAIPAWGWQDVAAARILVLDAVRDPGNLGTLIRTAEAIGLSGVACLPGTADPWNPKVARAAAGSSFRLPVFSTAWNEATLQIRRLRMTVWVAVPGALPFPRGEAAPTRLALVLGSEAHGVSEEIIHAADRTVSLPMAGSVESLNVAVAGGILMDRVFGG